jgi:hypothetical protein
MTKRRVDGSISMVMCLDIQDTSLYLQQHLESALSYLHCE